MKYISLIKRAVTLIVFIFLVVLAVIAADITVTYLANKITIPVKKEAEISQVKKTQEKKKELLDYKPIFEKNIFNVTISNANFFEKKISTTPINDITKPPTEVVVEPPEIVAELPKINIENYELYGTVVASSEHLSKATLYNKATSKYEVFGLNYFIEDISEIIAIRRNAVDIKVGNETVTLTIDEEKSKEKTKMKLPDSSTLSRRPPKPPTNPLPIGNDIQKINESNYVINRDFFENIKKDVMAVGRSINYVTHYDASNNPDGLEIKRIAPGFFQQLGIRNGDVIKSINGRELNAMSMQEMLQLSDEKSFNVFINRGNENTNLKYDVR